MKSKKARLILSLILLTGIFFTACHNSTMETWWEDLDNTNTIVVVSTDQTFHIVEFRAGEYDYDPGDQIILHGKKIAKVPAMSRVDHGFGGWYTTDPEDPGSFNPASEWDFATYTVTSDLILYARWVKDSYYTVKFVADEVQYPKPPEANPIPAVQRVVAGSMIIEPPAMRRGSNAAGWWAFGGWFTDPGFAQASVWNFATDRVTSDLVVSDELTLYALWDFNLFDHYMVRFEAYEGTPIPRDQDIIDGSRVVQPQAMSRTGHAFGGWFRDPGFTQEWNFDTDTVSSDLTLYAQWVTNYYTVIFDADGGQPAPANQRVAYGTTVTRPLAMGKSGNGFLGWYSDAGRTSPWDFDTPITGDRTLYAGWGDADITIKFDLKLPPDFVQNLDFGLGIIGPADQVIVNGGKIIEPTSPSISGWSFNGWYYFDVLAYNANPHGNRGSLNEWDFDTSVNDDDAVQAPPGEYTFTLYARWVPHVENMVWVRRGSFSMGAPGSGTSPVRDISLSGFYTGKFEVTQALYKEVMDWAKTDVTLLGLLFDSDSSNINSDPSHFKSPTRPVEKVSWYDAVMFCYLMTEMHNFNNPLDPLDHVYIIIPPIDRNSDRSITNMGVELNLNWPDNNGYRLPTEAEWEYAARGGPGSPGGFNFAGSNDGDEVAWFNTNSGGMTHPVGTKAPNALGIYDMNGNVSEWCWDWYALYSLHPNPVRDHIGPVLGTTKIRRGGGWSNAVNNVRNVIRTNSDPDMAQYVNGFRLARGPSELY